MRDFFGLHVIFCATTDVSLMGELYHPLDMLRIAKDSLILPDGNSSRRKDHDCLDIHRTRGDRRRPLIWPIRVAGGRRK
jgi:hypothetical protein